ncbi:hypothetical protein JD844_000021 [Phrynosoma platyrhinos]|uniref:C-factor n=1 Tax=Phrynosoma platyrhinos TaxID=52577 RepID=A0ABQ7SQ03_PHRPL|nr:hypothetical protein JD844_000021 [Phrynosoma platyrhinos]
MEGFRPRSVLVTGSDRGIGLGLVKRFLEMPDPPEWIFATSLNLDSCEGKELMWGSEKAVVMMTPNGACKGCMNRSPVLFGQRGAKAGVPPPFWAPCQGQASLSRGLLCFPKAFLPLLKKAAQRSPRKEGLSCSKAAIVNISSDFGSLEKMSGWCLSEVISYRCSKTAVNMLTRCQSLQYKPFGIFAMSIHPGWVKTAMGTMLVPQTVEESSSGIVKVLSSVTEKDTGSFIDWEGNAVPW